MKNVQPQRVLCLDLRSRRFGYVIFEGPQTLLDWGIRSYANEARSSLERKLDALQSMFRPSLILVRESELSCDGHALQVVKNFAKHSSLAARFIDRPSLHSFFSRGAKMNKYDIARIVAEHFAPELSWRLPARRKPWQSEPARQSLFDAASVGLFYFSHVAKVKKAAQESK